MSGIGFIGAGTILLRGEVVKGLTTAASLWIAAAIGLAVGGGLYIAAGATTLLTLAILAGLKSLEDLRHRREKIGDLVISARSGAVSIDALRDVAGLRPSSVRQFIVRPGQCEGEEEITIAFSRLSSSDVDRVAEQLRKRPGVLSAERADRGFAGIGSRRAMPSAQGGAAFADSIQESSHIGDREALGAARARAADQVGS